jgi:hypothetical protein
VVARRAEALISPLYVWLTFVVVCTDDWCDTAVHRQSQRACGGSAGSGGAGSSCEPSHGGLVGGVFGLGSGCPLDGLWAVRVSVAVGRLHAMAYGVVVGILCVACTPHIHE